MGYNVLKRITFSVDILFAWPFTHIIQEMKSFYDSKQ